jgi:Lon protease-like protein
MENVEKIPLFPLGLVMLPEMHLPLHIFEERYKHLINDCIKNKKDFGIVYYNGSTLLKHGSSVRVEQIIRTYEDGRMDLLGQGKKRFFITKIYEDSMYMEADVRYYDDEQELYDVSAQDLAKEALDCLKKIADLSGKSFNTRDFESLDLKKLSFLLSASDILSTEEKQENLESVSLQYRLEKVITAAARHIERITTTQKIQKLLGDDQDISHLFN